MANKETEQEWIARRTREVKQEQERMHCDGDFAGPHDTFPPLGQHHFEPPPYGGMMTCIRCGFTLGQGRSSRIS